MTKKKFLIILGSVAVALVGLIILLSFTLFSLKKIEIDYRTSVTNFVVSDEEIIESADINMGGSVFFKTKSKYIERLEKKYPYIKVVNIETVFPSKFVIHIAERQEIYAIKHNGLYHICDNELKILRITDVFDSTQENAILITGTKIKEGNYAVCDKLVLEDYVDIYESLYSNNRTLGEQQSLIKSINFEKVRDDVIKQDILIATLNMFDGQVYKIKNCEYGLKYKTKLFLDVYSQIFTYIGKDLKLKDESIIPITEELLYNCVVEINNYYDYTKHTEKDCYFNIIPNTQL